jgi:peptidoglycan/xylan/chitin deacetylase (PgdA/CDA1 family)
MIILNFHGIGEPSHQCSSAEMRYWLSCERFEEILDLACEASDVRVTFDDGNLSDVQVALPSLVARGLSPSFFIVAGWIGRAGFVSAADLRELLSAGMTIGSHGMAHVSWRAMSATQRQREIVDARDTIEQTIGSPIHTAACPFGAYDRASLAELRRAGFRHVMTSDRQPTEPIQWLQARYTVRADDTNEQIKAILGGHVARPAWLHQIRTTVKQWHLLAQ